MKAYYHKTTKECQKRKKNSGRKIKSTVLNRPYIARKLEFPITALLVLKQEERIVERCELDEAEVEVPEEAPVWHGGSERGEACTTPTDDDMGCRVETPDVIV